MRKLLLLDAILSLGLLGEPTKPARAHVYVRQYYDTSWTCNEINSYCYGRYYYRPTVTVTTYSYHYVVSDPSYPRYYYFNGVSTTRVRKEIPKPSTASA